MRIRRTFLLLCFFLSLPFSLFATRLSLTSADSVVSSLREGSVSIILSGHVVLAADGKTISSDRVEIYGEEKRFIECTGEVILRDDERGFTIRSPHLFFDRKRGFFRMRGMTTLEDTQNGFVLRAHYLEGFDEDDRFSAQIGVRLMRDDIVARGAFAELSRDTKILTLSGLAEVREGETLFQAERISVNLSTKEISLEGAVSGSFTSTQEPNDPTPPLPSASGTEKSPLPEKEGDQ